jgi:hypothetical protein
VSVAPAATVLVQAAIRIAHLALAMALPEGRLAVILLGGATSPARANRSICLGLLLELARASEPS